MKWLVDEVHPSMEIIRIVLDHLATHKPGALYKIFAPEEARRILRKVESHYTPKHGSWLNMAEIKLSVFGRTIWNYTPDEQAFISKAQTLASKLNGLYAKVNWQFRSADACIKLEQLYPSISV